MQALQTPPIQNSDSPDIFANLAGRRARVSLSPHDLREQRALSKRQAAADWIAATIGIAIPYHTDEAFRQSLSDGVVLCKLINVLQPGSIPRILETGPIDPTNTGEVIQTFENISNFVAASQKLTGETLLSARDLEQSGDRPQVVECILSLRDWQAYTVPGLTPRPSSAALPPRPSSRGSDISYGGDTPRRRASYGSGYTPSAEELVRRRYGSDAVEYMMRSATFALKTRMGVPATPIGTPPASMASAPPDLGLDAVGPVLENVLANLTNEYEKRLLAKDQDYKSAIEGQERMKRRVVTLEEEAKRLKDLLHAPQSAPVTEEGHHQLGRLRDALLKAEESVREAEKVKVEAIQRANNAFEEMTLLREKVQSLESLEERYAAVKDENRRLYNTVQDLKGAIRVFARVRPCGATGDSSAVVVDAREEEGGVDVFSHRHNKLLDFTFDRVFGQCSRQEDVYTETAPLVRSVLDGYNVCIFAYGQTGSGKTHTMSGDQTAPGINPRALHDLFAQAQERSSAGEMEYSISVQLLEIYNESLKDLLRSGGGGGETATTSLQIIATAPSGANVPEATQIAVETADDVAIVLETGSKNRSVAETRMNDRSSRSHQVLTIIVEGVGRNGVASRGCLHLIDLAGSERVARSGAEGKQLLEAQHINKSLSALGNVMHALASKREHVPFRDSKLTQLLQDSLGGNAKAMMFIHVAPESSSASETLSTLNFGKTVTEITLGAATKNIYSQSQGVLTEAKSKIVKMEHSAGRTLEALEAERAKCSALESEVETLRNTLALLQRQKSLPPIDALPSARGGGTNSTIKAHRPDGTSPGLMMATPTPQSGIKTPIVPKLALGGLGGGPTPKTQVDSTGKLGTAHKTPMSARFSRIPAPTPPTGNTTNGSMTSRLARQPSPMLSARKPLTARGEEGREGSLTARLRMPEGGGGAGRSWLAAQNSGGSSSKRWV